MKGCDAMKTSLLLSSILALGLAGGVAMAQTEPGVSQHAGSQHAGHSPMHGHGAIGLRGDANGDGTLTRAELDAQVAKAFARLDANGDGKLDRADREAAAKQRFAKADSNGDGEISQTEMEAARTARQAARAKRSSERRAQWFAKADTDQSGGLSQAELKAVREAGRQRWAERRADAGKGTTDGEPGRRWHGRRGGHHGGGHGMAMLRMADTNGDQAISQAEFRTAATKLFDMADADHDGQVTQAERQAAHKAMKARWRERRGGEAG